jgi:hypothetical protein
VAVLLAWPALANGYPILFSDTHAYLVQAGQPRMIWDKPWTYGPFLLALHGNTTLWLPLAGQVLILSHLLWLVQASLGQAGPLRHLLLGAILAAGSAAPWVASTLMPDLFAPVAVLGLWLVAFPGSLGPWQRGWIGALTGAAIAFHLSHLVIAAGCLAAIAVIDRRRLAAAALPLAGALAVLVGTNIAAYGRVAVSPYGSVFLLARLDGDGLLEPVLERNCPRSGWSLCAWQGRLPRESDRFLWDGDGPVWSTPGGPVALAPEAAAIVSAAMREEPLAMLRAAAAGTLGQMLRVGLGDTLGPDWLESSVTGSLKAYFPPAELARFRAGLQARGRLAAMAVPLDPLHAGLLVLAVLAVPLLPRRLWPLEGVVLAGVVANAFATGALSGVHDRYEARIAWLVLLPPLLGLLRWARGPRPRRGSCGPAFRSP